VAPEKGDAWAALGAAGSAPSSDTGGGSHPAAPQRLLLMQMLKEAGASPEGRRLRG